MADFELPGYEIFERLGRGGMATVYRALHLNLDREVAIKVMDPSMSRDESFSERFIREARISARLTHPHILQIYDVNTYEGLNYIAMELLSGGELADFIRGSMPQLQIYQIIEQMTDALDYAAGRGYVHRDIKPSNIMLRGPTDFVLADFGIARAANSGTQMTQTGLMVGTPSYMSPEQAKGQEVDGRSDLYAMAVLVYEMLTKKLPYESDSPVTTAVMHLTEAIPTLPDHLSAYQGFLDKAMAKAADDRFQTGREMFLAFREASAGFEDDQVLTEGEAQPARPPSGVGEGDGEPTSLAGVEATRLSGTSSPAISGSSRPYRLESSTQRERLVSGTYEAARPKQGNGSLLRNLALLVVLGAAGYGGYYWWQGQQGGSARDLQGVTAELAAAYGAMNDDNLPAAASAFYRVLSKDPGNRAAEEGMAQVGAQFERRIETAIADGDVTTARALILDYSGYFAGSLKLDRYTAEAALAEEQANLAAVQEQRIGKLTEQALAAIDAGDTAAAHRLLAEAATVDADAEAVVAAQQRLQQAEQRQAEIAAFWSGFSAAERDSFYDSVERADSALSEGDLDAAADAVAAAAGIAPDAPELAPREARLADAREQQAEQAEAARQALAAQLAEADQLASAIAADPANAGAAVAAYQQVLAADPVNRQAQAGLDGVAGYYRDQASAAAAAGDFDGARALAGTGIGLLPDAAALAGLESVIARQEKDWKARQAEAEKQRQAEQAARKRAEELAARGQRAIGNGALDAAGKSLAELEQDFPDSELTGKLASALVLAYADAARQQIADEDYDAAETLVRDGAARFPAEPVWQQLQGDIDGGRSSSRRRLGAY